VEGVLVKASLISLVRKGFPIAATILLLVALLFYSNLILLRVESVPQSVPQRPAFLGFSLIALNLPLTEGRIIFSQVVLAVLVGGGTSRIISK
jgi:hypothetical protein